MRLLQQKNVMLDFIGISLEKLWVTVSKQEIQMDISGSSGTWTVNIPHR